MKPSNRILTLFAGVTLLTGSTLFAQTITPATGGEAVSADLTGGAYSTLSGPVFSEAVSGDVGVGTIIFNAPSGLIFDIGGTQPTVLMNRISGVGGNQRNIDGLADGSTIAITSITTTQITLTISSASNSGVTCRLTWQNVRVRPSTGVAGSGNMTSSGTSTIVGVTSGVTNWGTLTVVPGAFTKMQLLVPGETAAPGTGGGKSGTPTAQTAGSVFNVTVNAVDQYWNIITSVTHTVGITSSDANASLPADAALVSGTKTFGITLKTAGSATVTATNITDGTKTADTSPSITVNAGAFAKLQLLVPGETAAAGTTNGKTGTPTAQAAGTTFTVTVNAVDANWNLVNSVTDNVSISSSDANATLPANAALVGGTKTYNVTYKTAGSQTVTANDVTDGTKTASTSPSMTVNAGAFVKLQLLMPGETAAPGTASGKTGTANAQSKGLAFTVTVNAVDANWNSVNSTDVVGITSIDPAATLPANTAMVNGTQTFSVTFNTVGSATVTATDVTDGTKTASTSPSVAVVLSKLILATGGEALSADNTGGSYTYLVGPVYEEGSSGDVGVGTIILNAPTGFEFDAGGTAPSGLVERISGSGPDAQNINGIAHGSTIGPTSRTATQLTMTITSASSGGVLCRLTWQNVRIRPSTGVAGSGNITSSGTSTIVGVTSGVTNWGTLAVVPGAFTKMQLLVPGESAAPGTAGGKTGTPTAQTAGSVFNVTVNAVDQYWNVVTGVTHTVGITSSDANASLPADAALVSGSETFGITLKTAGSATITATNITDGTKTANTSPSMTVNAGAFAKLQLLLPGETAAAGTTNGKTGAPTAQTAGTGFTVTVNGVDANWNVVTSVTDNVSISSSDANATLPANAALVGGTKTFSVTYKTAGSGTVTASDVTDGTKTASTSPSMTVNAGAFVKLQLLMPGETAAPGTASGKTGTATAQTKALALTVTVNAVDANWNVVSSTDVVGITSSDPAATLPANAALVSGTKTFNVTFNTAGSATVTATDVTDGTKTANTGPPVQVVLATLTQATGGSAISADNTGGAYVTLTGPVYGEGASGGIGTGTFILNAPSGFEFDAGGTAPTVLMNRIGGAGGSSRNINGLADASSIALTSRTTTQLTLTITSASNTGVTCQLTWQNIRVRPTTGAAGSGNITSSGTSTITGVTHGSTNWGTLTVVAGAFVKMQLLVPGESASPGVGSGKIGSPTAQASGTPFNVTVKAVDLYWNLVNTVTNTAGITSNDPSATLPANAALVAGTKTFNVTLNTVGASTLTATNITDGTKTANTSPSITVNAGGLNNFLVEASGGGNIGTQAAGTAFTIKITARDVNNNTVTSFSGAGYTATITSTGTLSSGGGTTAAFTNGVVASHSVTISNTGSFTITATKTAGSENGTSNSFTVNPGAAAKVVFVQQPSNATKDSVISPAITVQLKDANNNLVSSSGVSVTMSLTSGTGTLSGTTSQTTDASGVATFNDLKINQTGSKALTASSSGLLSATSNSFSISSGSATQLVFVQQPWDAEAGAAIAPAVTVQLKDAEGNNFSASGVSVTIALTTGTGTLSGTTTQTTSATGLATFNNLSINLPGSKNLTASSAGLTSAVSNSFTIANLTANVKMFLQGPFSSGTMGTGLATAGYLPKVNPFGASPWSYAGGDSVQSTSVFTSNSIVDWVLVELRSTYNGAAVARRAALLRNDGILLDTNATAGVKFESSLGSGNYYIVIKHRNHLAIMSANAVALTNGSVYDFTTAQTQAYGTNPMKSLTGGVFGMISGDANASNGITATDRMTWQTQNGTMGYLSGDFNLSGGVTASDRTMHWQVNNGTISQVP